ncbi:hypothetical protein M3Y97_00653900 [Aphelenchoides bicaudatus]|nr:hypothetical protein M3Y97_00653900 [Aphelenchoides bicaudatus]
MFILPHGLEMYTPSWLYCLFIIPHGFVAYHGLYILGAQFKYRHDLITKTNTTWRALIKVIMFTVPCGLYSGVTLAYAIYQSRKRGDDYYKKLMDGPWFNTNAKKYFMYAVDIRDLGGQLLFYGSLLISIFWFGFCFYYSWKAYKHVHKNEDKIHHVSDRTKELQRQYHWSLVIQTLNAILFAVIPVSIICVSVSLYLKSEFLGIGGMSPLNWLPAANGIATIYIVKPYRAYVLGLFHIRSGQVTHTSNLRGSFNIKTVDRSTSHSYLNNPH